MRRNFISLVLMIGILFWSFPSQAASESQRRFIEDLLITEGLEPSQAQRIMQDPRISVRPDIVVKNLFYSKPRGTKQKPDIMAVDPRKIERGSAFMKEHAAVLSAVEKRFGASPRIITAILIVESWLGTYPMPYNVANAYVNLAFLLDPNYLREVQDIYAEAYPQLQEAATIARVERKAKWAMGELCYLVHIANHLDIDPLSISGSFAGAMGPAQFIPSSFWIFGVDGDRDGISNPFNMADAIPSMGHYLSKYGWREDAPLEQKRKALWYYNRSDVYVNTVMMIYEQLGR